MAFSSSPFLLLLLLLLLLLSLSVLADDTDNDNDDEIDLIQPMIDWLRSSSDDGGYFSSKLEISLDEHGFRYGMFAKQDIKEDELLLVIPRSLLLMDDDGKYADYENYEWESYSCATVYHLVDEMKKKSTSEKSKYEPYINYLKKQSYGQIPSGYSQHGKEMLYKLLGYDEGRATRSSLPPSDVTSWLGPHSEWETTCEGSSTDPLQHQAVLLLMQRGWDDLFIPVYDMMSHRNGWYLNTKSNSVHDPREPVQVWASRDVQRGEELYTSYNFCEDCGNRDFGYGTPEIFRDYGFVENFPQRWFFWEQEVYFELDYHEQKDELVLEWLWDDKEEEEETEYERPSEEDIDSLRDQLQRLQELDLTSFDDSIPSHELESIRSYHEAIMQAIEMALISLDREDDDDDECSSSDEDDNNTCLIRKGINRRYDTLEYQVDDLDYFHASTCDDSKSLSFDGFEMKQYIKSHYQELEYAIHVPTNDSCFFISGILQICTSYQPHYHEMVVHYASRFLSSQQHEEDQDKLRVLFVGGGDSMLLHEILKLKYLDLVVGLEIDQVVTRLALYHFGMSPHYDLHNKVQWWYGDAAKSLLMLPSVYFGTFDLVLVDLSETITSHLVTDELNILQALGLLLKPKGILVKNELYLEKMMSISKHTLLIDIPHVPYICDQVLVFGSQSTNFLSVDMNVHHELNSDTMYLKRNQDKVELWHDYRYNDNITTTTTTTTRNMCKTNKKGQQQESPTIQKRSPGILMIVEVEDITKNIDLKDTRMILKLFSDALKNVDVQVLSSRSIQTRTSSGGDGSGASLISILLQEGYIMIQVYPQYHYIGLDIHLWSSFDKQEDMKQYLIQALLQENGSSSSSFRIVAGGMFGISTWKQDEVNRGPPLLNQVSCTSSSEEGEEEEEAKEAEKVELLQPKEDDAAMTEEESTLIANMFLKESIKQLLLSNDRTTTMIVVCGSTIDKCSSIHVLQDAGMNVIPLLPCSDISNEYQEDLLNKMISCEEFILDTLLQRNDATQGIIFDSTCTYTFARIVYKVIKDIMLSKERNNSLFNRQDFFAMSSSSSSSSLLLDSEHDDNAWQRNLMELFRKEIILYHYPCFRTQVVFKKSSSSSSATTMDMTISGKKDFIPTLKQIVSNTEESGNLKGEIHDISGGLYQMDPNWNPTYYKHEDFANRKDAYEQYLSQQPVGYQTIVQLEPKNDDNMPSSSLQLSMNEWKIVLKSTLKSVELISNDDDATFHSSNDDDMDGCIIVALWSSGSCVLLWDGRIHVDLNLFTYREDSSLHDGVEREFKLQLKKHTATNTQLETSLKDVQPRGYGRVVNFQSDLKVKNEDGQKERKTTTTRPRPIWAKFKEDSKV